jgi:hypothetical protein
MKLTLLKGSRTIKNGKPGSGDVCGFDVNGLPEGEHAKIAFFNHTWRILRWNDEWHGNWTGSYPTPDAAVESLREELLAAV